VPVIAKLLKGTNRTPKLCSSLKKWLKKTNSANYAEFMMLLKHSAWL